MQQIELWEIGILLIGVAFIILAVYLAKTFKNISKAMEDINAIVNENTEKVNAITTEIESMTNSASIIMDDVQTSIDLLKKTVSDIEKTVKITKNYMLSPLLKTITYSQSALKLFDSVIKDKKSISKKSIREKD